MSVSLTTWVGSVLAACDRFTESRKRCFLLALALAVVVFAAGVSGWWTNDLNDDYAIAAALSGNWGEGDGLCLFLNALLAQFIFFLNTTLPFGNWFANVELATAFASYLTLVYLALRRTTTQLAAVLIAGLTLLIVPGCTLASNFTFVGGIASCAGVALLTTSLTRKRHHALPVIVGLVFCALGIMWRYKMFLLCIPFFGIAGLVHVLSKEQRLRGVGRSLARLWPYAAALLVFAALFVYNSSVWHQEPWQSWWQFNEARSDMSDYPNKPYDSIAKDLKSIGVSKNDYRLVNDWITEDPDFFTTERIEDIARVSIIDLTAPSRIAYSLQVYFTDKIVNARLFIIVLAALAVSIATLKGRYRRTAIALLAVALAISLVFTTLGRLPARVHYSIWIAAIVAICCCVPRNASRPPSGARSSDDSHGRSRGVARSVVSIAAIAMPAVSAIAIVAVSLSMFSVERLEATFLPRSFEPECSLIDYFDEHPDNIFVVDARAYADVRFAYKLRGVPSHEVLSRSCMLGGWSSRSPFQEAHNAEVNMPNVIKGLVENDSALLVWHRSSPPDILVNYLREHYYPNASCTLVDTIDNSLSYGKLYVYKFSKQAGE